MESTLWPNKVKTISLDEQVLLNLEKTRLLQRKWVTIMRLDCCENQMTSDSYLVVKI